MVKSTRCIAVSWFPRLPHPAVDAFVQQIGVPTMARVPLDPVSGAVKLGLSGAVMVALGRAAARGRLPRNLFVGIRIPSTLRSDQAWRAGHLAAASALTVSGIGPIVVAALIALTRPAPRTQVVLSRISSAWLLGWLGRATFKASRAARAEGVS